MRSPIPSWMAAVLMWAFGGGLSLVPSWARPDSGGNGSGPVRCVPVGDDWRLELRGRPVAVYQGGRGDLPAGVPEEYRRAGYLHPLVTPTGQVVTGDYPANHLHHHGIWAAWTHTEWDGRAPDFWNMGQRKGRVEFVQGLGTETTAAYAEVRGRHRYVDLTASSPVTVLEEDWTVRLWATPEGAPHQLDLTLVQRNVSGHPLRLPKYHYGGLGFRGLDAWDGAANCRFLTSEGITNRVAGNESRGRWCWIGGALPGGWAGITILGHPENVRAPEPMRLHPTEPFFCFAPQQLGDMAIEAGGTHRARYRILIGDGQPDAAALDQQWRAWIAAP